MELSGRPDAVVIGAGAGGAAAAWRLTAKGLRVLLLEAGPRFVPARDYPLDRPGWERRGFPDKPGSRARILYGDLGTLDPAHDDLASRNAVRGRLSSGDLRRASALGYAHTLGVGGTTLQYVGEAHRLHPDAFRLRSRTGQGADWPVGYDDLEPYYTLAETVLGVAGGGDGGPRRRSGPFPLPPHPMSPAAARLIAAGAALGASWEPNPRAALSRPYDGRPPCNYCGQCSRGCPLGDKGSADVTFLRRAEATGRLDLVPDAQAIRIEAGPGGRVAAVEVAAGRARHRVETPVLVLAGGAVQTPRLLLASASPDQPEGIANGAGHVGRHFLETLSWSAAGLARDLRNSHMGLPADAISWDHAADGAAGGFRLGNATQEIGLTGPIGYASRLIPGHGAAFKRALRDAFGSALAVGALGETVADARSFVALDPEARDAHGVPLPVIRSVLTDNSLRLLHAMAEAGRAHLRAAGVGEILEQYSTWDRFTSTHVFGTCRMAAQPSQGVVDGWGRSFDHENLWIADASVFPSSGAGESPSLTIHALAIRSADRILA